MAASVPGGQVPRRKERSRARAPGGTGGSRRRPGLVVELLESRLLLTQTPLADQVQRLPVFNISRIPVNLQVLPQSSGSTLLHATVSISPPPPPPSGPVVTPLVPSSEPVITLQYNGNPSGTDTATEQLLISTPVGPGVPENSNPPGTDPTNLTHENAELTSSGLEKLPTIPMMEDVTVSGDLAPRQPWSTYKIPVDRSTESLHVTVSHDPSLADPMVPALDQLYLVGPTGNLLAQLTGASAIFQGLRQDLRVGLSDVPLGSCLVVRIIEAPVATASPSSPSSPTATSSTSSGASAILPFTMEVVRSELSATSYVTGDLGQTFAGSPAISLPFGYAPISTTTLASWPSLSEPATAADTTGPALPDNLAARTSAATSAAQAIEEPPVVIPGVSVGPLVSRGTAPLGPLLGTTPGDPTPALDRSERAFDVSTAGLNATLMGDSAYLTALTARLEAANAEGTPLWQPTSVRGDGASFVALRGPGGFPTLVTSAGGTRAENDPAAILATVSVLSVPEYAAAATTGTHTLSTSEIRALDPHPAPDLLPPDFFEATCGLILGISLTAGPLYPDLMAMVRNWLPSRPRRSRPISTLRTRASRSGHHPPSWLGLPRWRFGRSRG
ncbi:MAG: hypothetical protein ACP5XB_10075 [Isosphaeraceae bacterium]